MVEPLTPYFLKQTTFMSESLEVGLTLATTFHFLANGNVHANMQYSSNLSKQKHNLIFFLDVCKAIVDAYKDTHTSVDMPKF